MTKLLKYPYLAYLWCMEKIMWYRYRRAWAYAMTHPHDQEALAAYNKALEDHDRYFYRLIEVRNG